MHEGGADIPVCHAHCHSASGFENNLFLNTNVNHEFSMHAAVQSLRRTFLSRTRRIEIVSIGCMNAGAVEFAINFSVKVSDCGTIPPALASFKQEMPWKAFAFDSTQFSGCFRYVIGIRQQTAGLVFIRTMIWMRLRPERALAFGAIETVERFHIFALCPVQEQLALLVVLDTQAALVSCSLGLYSHLQGPIFRRRCATPSRRRYGPPCFLRKSLKVNAVAMPRRLISSRLVPVIVSSP